TAVGLGHLGYLIAPDRQEPGRRYSFLRQLARDEALSGLPSAPDLVVQDGVEVSAEDVVKLIEAEGRRRFEDGWLFTRTGTGKRMMRSVSMYMSCSDNLSIT